MKRLIWYEIARVLKQKPLVARKLKVLAAVGFVVFLVAGTLIIGVGVSAGKYLVAETREMILSPETRTRVEESLFNAEAPSREQILRCWDHARSLLSVRSWLERPAFDNFSHLKLACFQPHRAGCTRGECEQTEALLRGADGRVT